MTSLKSQNVTWHAGQLTRAEREHSQGHRGVTLWFTGLSGSGKSTLASAVERRLADRGVRVYTLDGDNVRHGLCGDLGFSPDDRSENVRRIGEVCKLFTDAAIVTLAAFVSPYRTDRARVRALLGEGDFLEIYVSADLAVCEQRDPKGLYVRARAGEITDFTGVNAPYEPPQAPELTVHTDREDVGRSVEHVLSLLEARKVIAAE